MDAKKNTRFKAVLLDRDGTLIAEKNFLSEIEQVEILPGAIEAVKILNKLHYKVIVVSNQSGVARGFFSEDKVREINNYIREVFKRSGAFIDDFYFCPHHPQATLPQYRKACNCRKPAPGMAIKAAREHRLNLKKCVVIGDKISDVQFGKNIGAKVILVKTGYGEETLQSIKNSPSLPTPDHVATDILDAAHFIQNYLIQPSSD